MSSLLPQNIGFSTCWNQARHRDGEDIIDEILMLGFSSIELSHGMSLAKLPGFQRAYQNNKFQCLGVHNYFPAPIEVLQDNPDAYECNSNLAYHRQRFLRLATASIRSAAEFEAKYLVLHLGSTPLTKKMYTAKLEQLLSEQKPSNQAKIQKLRDKLLKKRARVATRYYQRSVDMLQQLLPIAKEYNIILAIESRSHLEQTPSETEMLTLQQLLHDNPYIRYWHDFGHVERKHQLGLLDHHDWLTKMQPYSYGAHIHDVQAIKKDHRVPFSGNINFAQLLPLLPVNAPLIWELSPSQRSADIKASLTQWRQSASTM